MAGKQKLSEEMTEQARRTWEADSRDGFAWLVSELGLPVTAPGIRRVAVRDKWEKGRSSKGSAAKQNGGNNSFGRNNRNNPGASSDDFGTGEESAALVGTVLDARTPTPALDALDPREKTFVLEYVQCSNASEAARKAGYSEASAGNLAARLIKRGAIQAAIQEVMREKVENAGWSIERLTRHYAELADVDTSKITQHRIRACRHCWGINHAYQCTPEEFPLKRAEWKIKRQSMLERAGDVEGGEADIGEFRSHENDWYDGKMEPNPDCPECHGVGHAYTWFADVRNLTGAERKAYTGVKRTKDGIELQFQQPEAAIKMLATAVGMGKEQEKAETPVEVARKFADMMKQARERQAEVYKERGITRTDRDGGGE